MMGSDRNSESLPPADRSGDRSAEARRDRPGDRGQERGGDRTPGRESDRGLGVAGDRLRDAQLWLGILDHLKGQHAALCRQWFHEIEPLGLDAGVLRLRAHSDIHRDYLDRSCADAFNDAARSVSQRLLSVQFFGPEDEIVRASASTATPPARDHQLALDGDARPAGGGHVGEFELPRAARSPLPEPKPASTSATPSVDQAGSTTGPIKWDLIGKSRRHADDDRGTSLVINPDYTFEHFVVGPNNRLAHAAALAISASPGRVYNPFFIHGGVGLGKTHLLQAICLSIKQRQPDARIFYTSCEGFMTQFMDAVQAGEMAAFRHRFRDVDLLLIDDVHFLAKRDRTQEEFFHTFNALYQAQKQIVLSSDAPPEEIPHLEERLVSRFQSGLVTHVAAPAYETRMAILKNKAKMRGFVLSDEVAGHIAAKIDSNIRELEGVIVKLHVLSAVEKRPVDMSLAMTALGEEPSRSEKQVQIQTIISAVTAFYDVKMTDLQSKRRQRSIALPRQVCMYLARKHTRYSLEEIGGYFGGRDHTTVMHAVKTVEGRCEMDLDFGKVMQSLESTLRSTGA